MQYTTLDETGELTGRPATLPSGRVHVVAAGDLHAPKEFLPRISMGFTLYTVALEVCHRYPAATG